MDFLSATWGVRYPGGVPFGAMSLAGQGRDGSGAPLELEFPTCVSGATWGGWEWGEQGLGGSSALVVLVGECP